MIAFQVDIDGERVVVAGVEDYSVLALHVDAGRGKESTNSPAKATAEIRFSVGGLSRADPSGVRHHFRWPERNLAMGSTISVTIVDVENPDPPQRRYRSDKHVQQSPFTEEELREIRRQDYLELKKEFEGAGE
jgi:hypothetical protein